MKASNLVAWVAIPVLFLVIIVGGVLLNANAGLSLYQTYSGWVLWGIGCAGMALWLFASLSTLSKALRVREVAGK
jgi:hypothetical protein